MNLLAHAVLAAISLPEAAGQSRAGALMADFFSGQDLHSCPPAMATAIRQHQAIDNFTDHHKLFFECRRLVATNGAPRLTGAIVVDMFWGHLLAAGWDALARPLCGQDLTAFSAQTYAAIRQTVSWHSPAFARASQWIIDYRWLELYASRAGLARSLRGLAGRLSGAAGLADCAVILDRHRPAIASGFSAFWPQVVEFSQGWARNQAALPSA
ncbi:MAG: hypothetical protein A2087_06540 [Spirochaetes bacterium GWD1_61_31]|nr:MAG: hypothetical protein A2Y37_08930 [Spirochaetes bacterium GWB1_60_80]OHD31895.1 MAG: hypothetical protein A2004_10315 [Spirochaetes bacterium GWC1_61_12]OHD40008.1 MAG: hypothetical protein A2087_06540 [Spirochaetes bacterium GWD1_61_31]OHD42338.1 MAG: hypothetical protein A2Y35_11460 [Spirochaetes bacterium GWE1_60_18]OHD60510.1 MAG: hypothetical protein A2Y32_03675 [Spirochaetes bacterium GWF1_60_12]HAW86948.1 hypothetical protein [Spirochaetaceae bacterium]